MTYEELKGTHIIPTLENDGSLQAYASMIKNEHGLITLIFETARIGGSVGKKIGIQASPDGAVTVTETRLVNNKERNPAYRSVKGEEGVKSYKAYEALYDRLQRKNEMQQLQGTLQKDTLSQLMVALEDSVRHIPLITASRTLSFAPEPDSAVRH